LDFGFWIVKSENKIHHKDTEALEDSAAKIKRQAAKVRDIKKSGFITNICL